MARKTKEEAQETRNKLLDTAEKLFHEKGVSRTSLADIAEAAGMTRGAIYWHFENKVDLFNAMFDRVRLPMEAVIDESQREDVEDPLGEFRKTVGWVFSEIVHNEHFRLVFDILFHKCEFVAEMGPIMERDREQHAVSLERISGVLRNAERRGQLKPGLNYRLAAVAFHGFICGLISDWLFATQAFDLEHDGARLADAFFEGLRVSESLRIQ